MKVTQVIIWDVPGVNNVEAAQEKIMAEFKDASTHGPVMEFYEVKEGEQI